jgi:hypothetical protein
MQVKLNSIYASPQVTAQPGSTIDVSDEEGQSLVKGGYGIEVKDETAVPASAPEAADVEAPENAAGRTGPRATRSRTS